MPSERPHLLSKDCREMNMHRLARWSGINVPGCDNRQLALNIMHWLSGLTGP
jgi:hypothetical protein